MTGKGKEMEKDASKVHFQNRFFLFIEAVKILGSDNTVRDAQRAPV